MKKKIIGYKAPCDMGHGKIKKDEIFFCKGYKHISNNAYVYRELPSGEFENPGLYVELVQQWEPVYETYKVGDWVTLEGAEPSGWTKDTKYRTFQLTALPSMFCGGLAWSTDGGSRNTNKDGSGFGLSEDMFRPATEEEIRSVSELKIGAYIAEFPGRHIVKFGCQRFTSEVVVALEDLLCRKGDLDVDLKINGEPITLEFIQRLRQKIS